MSIDTAAADFVDRQKRLLVQIYDEAWDRGVDNYGKPVQGKPDTLRRAVALAPAFKSLNAMHQELTSLKPATSHQLREAYDPNQPRASDGKWSSDSSSSNSNSNGSDKTSQLTAGALVSASAPEAVQIVKELASRDSPTDLTNLHVTGIGREHIFDKPSTNLLRADMPQVPNNSAGVQSFAEKLGNEGIKAQVQQVSPLDLHASQSEINATQVGRLFQRLEQAFPSTLIVDKDGVILDGHHRWAAAAVYALDGHPNYTVEVLRCDAPFSTLFSVGKVYNAEHGIEPQKFG